MKTMKKKGVIMAFIGFILFMTGIYIASQWIIIAAIMSVGGGCLMGGSTYFLVDVNNHDKS